MSHTVKNCVVREDGGYLITTTSGHHGVASERMEPGSRVRISADGRVVKA